MQKIFRKRTIRDLKENVFRYLALMFLLILSMYLIVSMAGAADTIMEGSKWYQKKNNVEDGQFTVFVPLTKENKKELRELGVKIEEAFYLDYKLDDESVLRVFKNRDTIDKIAVEKGGVLAKKPGEIVVEKRYAIENKVKVGDTIALANQNYTVVGIGTVPDYDAPYNSLADTAVDSKSFGLGFVCEKQYQSLVKANKSDKSENYTYAYQLTNGVKEKKLKKTLQRFKVDPDGIDDSYFQKYWEENGARVKELTNGIDDVDKAAGEFKEAAKKLSFYDNVLGGTTGELVDRADDLVEGSGKLKDAKDEITEQLDTDIDNLTAFLPAKENMRIGAAADDQVINKNASIFFGVLLIALFAYVISVFTVHNIEKESAVIGALYALGVKRKELLRHYLTLPVLICFVGGLIGLGIGLTPMGIEAQMMDSEAYFSTPHFNVICKVYLIMYAVIMPAVIAAIVNYFVIKGKLSKTALSLIRNEAKQPKGKNINLTGSDFMKVFRIRQMLREARTGLTVVFGMFISLLCLMIGLNCYVLCKSVQDDSRKDTKFEYMYTYKYPVKDIPKGGYEAVGKGLSKSIYGYKMDVTLLGITDNNPYFDVELERGSNKVTVSSAFASKFQVKVGDQIVLTDTEADRDYAFTVTDITQYATSFFVFMNIDSMRELFGEEDDYFNVVFADKDLHIDSGYLYSTLTKRDIDKASGIFIKLMKSLIVMLLVASSLIFCIVMYLMMKVMVDRAALNISLIKVFGFRKKEIKKMYLDGNFYIVAIGALVSIPLSKFIMDQAYPPFMIANTACNVSLGFDWWLYVVVYIGILLFYLIVNQLLVGRLNKILPAEVLKNRE